MFSTLVGLLFTYSFLPRFRVVVCAPSWWASWACIPAAAPDARINPGVRCRSATPCACAAKVRPSGLTLTWPTSLLPWRSGPSSSVSRGGGDRLQKRRKNKKNTINMWTTVATMKKQEKSVHARLRTTYHIRVSRDVKSHRYNPVTASSSGLKSVCFKRCGRTLRDYTRT